MTDDQWYYLCIKLLIVNDWGNFCKLGCGGIVGQEKSGQLPDRQMDVRFDYPIQFLLRTLH